MASALRRVRVGVVGAGSMGSLHARIVADSDHAELSCVIDPDRDAAHSLAARHGTRWFADLDRIDLVDAVIVASSTETHRDWVEVVLAARRPVLVEKPLSTDLSESQMMVEQAEAAGVPIMCGFVERFNPAVMLAMETIEAPLYFQATRHSPYVHRIRSGVSHDLIIHDADLAIRAFGEYPEAVSATLGYFRAESAPGAEDTADVHLQFPSGGVAALSASRITQRKIRTVAISERDRLLEIDLIRQDVTIYRHVDNALIDGTVGYRAQTIVEIPAVPCRQEPLVSQFDHFLGLIHGSVDADAERRSVLPAHAALAAPRAGSSLMSRS